MKLGAARQQAPSAWRLGEVQLPRRKTTQKPEQKFVFTLRKDKAAGSATAGRPPVNCLYSFVVKTEFVVLLLFHCRNARGKKG